MVSFNLSGETYFLIPVFLNSNLLYIQSKISAANTSAVAIILEKVLRNKGTKNRRARI